MIKYLLIAALLIDLSIAKRLPVAKPAPAPAWLTLNGQRPVLIARGGVSGIFPDSSRYAYELVPTVSLRDSIYYCDLQLTKDGVGFCQTEFRLDNSTNIAQIFPQGRKTYNINGKDVHGWFAVDFSAEQIFNNVTLVQNILSRPFAFDGQQILSVEDVTGLTPGTKVWLNVQHDLFYHQHRLIDPALYLQQGLKFAGINYISSPEIGFLKNIGGKVDKARIKLVFRFLEPEAVEPTTKQTYGAIMKNLAAIKTFASGILVPKTYIWPVNKEMYLMPPTTLVADAHKAGLEVYASGFANDNVGSYNYSYDPSSEYLQFIDNGQFSVDGVLTDFPATASEAIACLAHNKNASKRKGKRALIISHDGASGDYAGCTDLAYEKAVMDGADVIDCSVQMSKDGVAFCMNAADLSVDTNAVTLFMSKSSSVPEIQDKNGVFSFDLTWSEIQTLKPQLNSPLSQEAALPRNPANKNKGKFMTLAQFLDFAKAKPVAGVLINIQNVPYLASKKGLDLIGAVTTALQNATFDKQSTKQVMIQSDDTSVLAKFKEFPSYKRVYTVEEAISNAPKKPLDEIKKYADTVDIRRSSLFISTASFVKNFTKVIEEMHAANLSVHVSTLYNEYTTLAFDTLADPLIELATIIEGLQADAVVTEYPATANAYMRSPCSDQFNAKAEYPIIPLEPGSLLAVATPGSLPPPTAPAPALGAANIVDPPLPPVTKPESPQADAPKKDSKNASNRRSTTNVCLSLVAALIAILISTTQ